MTAPIVLFVYNRPWHTAQTVTALQNNELAQDSELCIYSDGPKSKSDEEKVQEVRKFLRTINGFKKVSVTERPKNYGLAQSIISGVTETVDKFGEVIVLEDDLVTSPYFLRYMNEALKSYKHEGKVMHVSAGTYPIGNFPAQDTYFLRIPLCWGWGTWRRAWAAFNKDIRVMEKFDEVLISRFNFDNTYPYWTQLILNKEGKINTWFIFWYAQVFLAGGLSLFPRKPLVRNIGHDNTGVHCGKTSRFDVALTNTPINVVPVPVFESNEAVQSHKVFFRSIMKTPPRGLIQRIMHAVRGTLYCVSRHNV